MMHHQYGISTLIRQVPFRRETTGGVANVSSFLSLS